MPEMKHTTNHGYSSITQHSEDEDDYLKARQRWDALANERLKSVSQGDNFNPWTSVKQNFAAIPLYVTEKRLSQGSGIDYNQRRSDAFDKAMKQAEETALGKAKGYKLEY